MSHLLSDKKFYPAIDGLRALSFIVVFVFHAGVPGFRLGFGGITIFFAISGFLITEILLRNKKKKSYFRSFFIRRSLRIFPLYYVTISVPIVFLSLWYGELPAGIIYLYTYTQNYFYGIFWDSPYMSILAHTWTLAIEEQFYLIWPFIIYLIGNRYLKFVFPLLIVLSILFRTYGIRLSEYNFISLFSQMDSLILGSLLALATFNNVQEKLLFSAMKISLFLGILGIVFTLLYLANINETSFVNSFMQLGNTVKYANDEIGVNLFFFISLIAVGLIIACIKEHGFIFRICNIEILKHFGKISYGMYLFHYPILHFLRVISDNVMFLSVVGFTITYVVSIISFNTFELYFNRLKNKFTY